MSWVPFNIFLKVASHIQSGSKSRHSFLKFVTASFQFQGFYVPYCAEKTFSLHWSTVWGILHSVLLNSYNSPTVCIQAHAQEMCVTTSGYTHINQENASFLRLKGKLQGCLTCHTCRDCSCCGIDFAIRNGQDLMMLCCCPLGVSQWELVSQETGWISCGFIRAGCWIATGSSLSLDLPWCCAPLRLSSLITEKYIKDKINMRVNTTGCSTKTESGIFTYVLVV